MSCSVMRFSISWRLCFSCFWQKSCCFWAASRAALAPLTAAAASFSTSSRFVSLTSSNSAIFLSVTAMSQASRESFMSCPLATLCGVSPDWDDVRGSAPCSRSDFTAAAWPRKHARQMGVRPNSPGRLGSAPQARSSSMVDTEPPAAASDRRVLPLPSAVFSASFIVWRTLLKSSSTSPSSPS